MTNAERPKRRFPYILAMLVASVLLIVGAAVLTIWLPYHRVQTVISGVDAIGGRTYVVASVPAWMPERVGNKYPKLFDRISEIDLSYTQADSAFLRHLSGITSPISVRLNYTDVTDEGLANLRGMTDLEELSLDDTSVGNAGMQDLAGLSSLKVLSLANTHVTDAGLKHFAELTHLEYLCLYGTAVSKDGVEELRTKLPWCMIVFTFD